MKRLLHTAIVLSVAVVSLAIGGGARALQFSTDASGDNAVKLDFELGSTLTVTTSATVSIDNLAPGNKAISPSGNYVTVSTNNSQGYTLSASVGCASGAGCYNSKALSDGTNSFTMVTATGALTAGTWGISLDNSASVSSNFRTLALYSETATVINQTTNAGGTGATGYAGGTATPFRIGAYATDSQSAGTYTNVINFTAVANPAV